MINLKLINLKNLKGILTKWKKIYISMHRIQTKLVLFLNQYSIEEYEFEDKNNLNFKNNIYLATISRVEPSLTSCFCKFWKRTTWFFSI